jgi:two-component system cell cycle response regulator CpdR
MARILLAEDDEAMRGFLEHALSDAGFDVTAVADGLAAKDELERVRFDLLLSDIVMPGMGGIELARNCEHLWPGTQIVLITGFAAVALEASREAPRATMLSKPFHLRTLVSEVTRLIEQAGGECAFSTLASHRVPE